MKEETHHEKEPAYPRARVFVSRDVTPAVVPAGRADTELSGCKSSKQRTLGELKGRKFSR